MKDNDFYIIFIQKYVIFEWKFWYFITDYLHFHLVFLIFSLNKNQEFSIPSKKSCAEDTVYFEVKVSLYMESDDKVKFYLLSQFTENQLQYI